MFKCSLSRNSTMLIIRILCTAPVPIYLRLHHCWLDYVIHDHNLEYDTLAYNLQNTHNVNSQS